MTTTELSLMGSRNIATQKFFIFLEAIGQTQIKLINPAGKVLTVPKHIFEEPVSVHTTDFDKSFTPEQLITADKTIKKPRRKKATKKATKKVGKKTGLGATWTAPTLTFYKHHIEPLDPKQTFKINLENGDIFEMTKDEFNQVFSDIMLSKEYSEDGAYSFDEIPDRATQYLTSAES
jgi:hypothetical protein